MNCGTASEAKHIVFAGEDAGGALALAPVIRKLAAAGGFPVRVVAHRAAHRVWRGMGIEVEPFDDGCGPGRADRAAAIIDSASVLVTGTSWQGDDIEKHLITAARGASVPSVSVLDFWSNYAERFSGGGADGWLAYLPDAVAVMDDHAASEMVRAGAPEQVVHITGNPHLENLQDWLRVDPSDAKRRVLENSSMGPNIAAILFASQGLEALYGTRLGFTERTVLADLITACPAAGEPGILIKLHPSESRAKYAGYADHERIMVLDDEVEPRLVLRAADVVVGMRSTLLVESVCLDRRTVAYQPGLQGPDPMITNRLGASFAATSINDLKRALAEASLPVSKLWEPIDRGRGKMRLVANATDNLIALIQSFL